MLFKSLFAVAGAAVVAAMPFHTALKSSTPARNSVVASPTKVSLTFTEGVTFPVSAISIVKPDSSVVEKLVVTKTSDPATIEAAVPKPLPAGKYMINWKTGSDDGHVVRGMVPFTVK